jgi:hypothetical protein
MTENMNGTADIYGQGASASSTSIILYGTAAFEMPAAPAELKIRDPGCDRYDNVT